MKPCLISSQNFLPLDAGLHSIFLLWEEMSKKKLEVDWNLKTSTDLSVNLERYTRYHEDYGFRE